MIKFSGIFIYFTLRNTEKRSQPNQAFSRGSNREQKRKQFAIFPEGFNPHDELEG